MHSSYFRLHEFSHMPVINHALRGCPELREMESCTTQCGRANMAIELVCAMWSFKGGVYSRVFKSV